jgi:hypothetical protein
MLWVNNFRGQRFKTRKVHKENPKQNKAVPKMPWWGEATRCIFPIATEIPQHVGRRKRMSGSLPSIRLLCLYQFYFSAAVFTYAF